MGSKEGTALDFAYFGNFGSNMIFAQFVVAGALVVLNLVESDAHGMLMEPVNRGSAFRKGFRTPENWDDDGNYCGGYTAHFVDNKGKCGVCGDNYSDQQPRNNENGGKYGTGTIVKTYKSGQEFEAEVRLTANHMGTFQFAVCPLNEANDIENDECFAKYPVKLADGSDKYTLTTSNTGDFTMKLVLPEGLTCEHCSLRWNYRAANSWGACEDGTEALGCGDQETFRTCSDIKIVAA